MKLIISRGSIKLSRLSLFNELNVKKDKMVYSKILILANTYLIIFNTMLDILAKMCSKTEIS